MVRSALLYSSPLGGGGELRAWGGGSGGPEGCAMSVMDGGMNSYCTAAVQKPDDFHSFHPIIVNSRMR